MGDEKTSFYDDLIEVAAKKKDVINKKLNILLPEKEKEFNELLGDFKGDPSPDPALNTAQPPKRVMGVDGGSYQSTLLASDIYFIKTYGVTMRWSNERQAYKLENGHRILDIDLLIPPVHTQDRLTLYRQITEIRMMIKGLEEEALVMGDGSIESTITRPTHIKLYTLDTNPVYTCDEIKEIIEDKESDETAIATKDIVEDKYRKEPDKTDAVIKIELAEKAYYIKKMLETLLEKDAILVFMTKTGRSNNYFQKALPDQYILSMYTHIPGYLIEPVRTMKELLGSLPQYCGLRELSNQIYVLNGYVRYITNGPLMKIQFIASKEKIRKYTSPRDFFIEKLLETSKTTVEGYPIPLYLAHQKAHIEKKIVDIILEGLDLKRELSGRESIDVL